MNVLSKLILWAFLSCFVAFGAKAQDVLNSPQQGKQVLTSNTLLCGTADQAKHFVTDHPADLDAAIAGANDEHSEDNCLSAGVAFVPGHEVGRVQHKDGMFAVTEIVIVGVKTPYGIMAIKPNLAYTILKVKDVAA